MYQWHGIPLRQLSFKPFAEPGGIGKRELLFVAGGAGDGPVLRQFSIIKQYPTQGGTCVGGDIVRGHVVHFRQVVGDIIRKRYSGVV